jgi:two-component system cell cycle response regulator
MSARILIVDSVATNRIVLKVKLLAAQYDVVPCATIKEARQFLATEHLDLILMDIADSQDDAFELFRELKSNPDTSYIPIVVLGAFPTAGFRLAALRAGADDVLDKPVHDVMLQARIRSLLRSRDAANELRMREETHRSLGFAETQQGFTQQGKIAFVTPSLTGNPNRLRTIEAELGMTCQFHTLETILSSDVLADVPDVFVIDGVGVDESRFHNDIYRLVSELRTRTETRHSAQMVILPDQSRGKGAMVLDIGANDLVPAQVAQRELIMRIKALTARKLQQDRLRNTVRDGLKAAVTDPLTGLYNRRYAVPHLTRMAEIAQETGREFAMMVLDIDHFKGINDRYGHAVGDQVLIGVARRLLENLRSIDLVARIGGEEFLVAMPDTSPSQARHTAERLREIISLTPFEIPDRQCRLDVTMSIGVAMGCANQLNRLEIEQVFDRADAALYAAKSAGRNAVTMDLSAA